MRFVERWIHRYDNTLDLVVYGLLGDEVPVSIEAIRESPPEYKDHHT